MSLKNKIDFAVVLQVKNANPNGDPLNGNRPRATYDGLGEISDVCIKRKIRDRLMERALAMKEEERKGQEVFVQSDDRKCDDCTSLRDRAEKVLAGEKDPGKIANLACKTWLDVRAFGQLFAFKAGGKKKKAKEGEEAGDDKSVSIGIRGPVTVQSAFSLASVSVTSTQITKSVSGEGDGTKRGSDTMGMKHRVDHGVYVFFGSMNPQLAVKTGFSDNDAEVIKAVLPKLFENDASSARPEGSMRVLKVIWWQHNCTSGQMSSAKVHGSLDVGEDGSIKFKSKDLTVLADGAIKTRDDELKPEIIDGF
jgi:CRISPR-associated protein Csd2